MGRFFPYPSDLPSGERFLLTFAAPSQNKIKSQNEISCVTPAIPVQSPYEKRPYQVLTTLVEAYPIPARKGMCEL